MTRIIFYIYPEWAFGQVHYGLAKALYGKGVDASVLPWQLPYTQQEIAELAAVTDRFVTTPDGSTTLRTDYGIDPSQIIVIAHSVYDLDYMHKRDGPQAFNDVHDFVVVSDFLQKISGTMGIIRKPTVAHVGIDTSRYKAEPAKKLRTIGIAGKFHRIDPHTDYDLKRGYLVERCARELGLELRIAENYHNSFVTMAGFYPTVDCVIIASTEEGAGLPALEAAAAGRLVISTPVGHWPERAGEKGGITVPIEESAFTEQVIAALKKYQDDPAAFARTCRAIQKHAASYDWSLVADEWAALLSR